MTLACRCGSHEQLNYAKWILDTGLSFGQHKKQAAIKKGRVLACLDEIPTFIINMRPAGLRLFGEQNEIIAFDDEATHQSWEEYDATLELIVKVSHFVMILFVIGFILKRDY